MGCGTSIALRESSKHGYASFVKSIVTFNKSSGDEPKTCRDKQGGLWRANSGGGTLVPSSSRGPVLRDGQILRDGQQQKHVRYRLKFDPRVTARYDIKALIGCGSFSRVVRVEHRATRQPFAIKIMEVEAPESHEMCASELAVLRRVSHTNVVHLVEVCQSPQRVYMVLELATGGELLERVIAKGHFTERDATRALQMVLAGVAYLHALGITHRDLKPENLLYYHPGGDSRLLVTDFGLASFRGKDPGCLGAEGSGGLDGGVGDHGGGEDWSLTTTCGTPEYMAPEVVLRRPYSCAVDMWALGVIAYIVLSGSMPFEDNSHTRLYRTILRGKYSFRGDPWPSVSNLAKDFIQRLLAVDPDARLTAEQAICHPWVVTMAASSSMKNLHRSISQNLQQRASRTSSVCPSSDASSGGGGSSSVGLGRASSRQAERKLMTLEKNQEVIQQQWQRQLEHQDTSQPQRAIHQSPGQVQPGGSTTTTAPTTGTSIPARRSETLAS